MYFDRAPCSGPGLRKCLRCAAHPYGPAKGIVTAVGNMVMAPAEMRAIDIFLPVSQATARGNRLEDLALPFTIVPNFVSLDTGGPSDSVRAYLAQLPDEPFVLFVGDFRRVKGIEVLLHAYATLESRVPLVIIGKPNSELPTAIPQNVHILENWPHDAVVHAWRRCLLGLVPSVWSEPFGLVVLEAMAAGRPVVASRIGGIPDIMVDGETGVLVTPGDAGELQRALAYLLSDPGAMERMGRTAKRRVAMFSAAVVMPQVEELYAALVTHK